MVKVKASLLIKFAVADSTLMKPSTLLMTLFPCLRMLTRFSKFCTHRSSSLRFTTFCNLVGNPIFSDGNYFVDVDHETVDAGVSDTCYMYVSSPSLRKSGAQRPWHKDFGSNYYREIPLCLTRLLQSMFNYPRLSRNTNVLAILLTFQHCEP